MKPKTTMVLDRFLARREVSDQQNLQGSATCAGMSSHTLCQRADTVQPSLAVAAALRGPHQLHRTTISPQLHVRSLIGLNSNQKNALEVAGLSHSQSSAEL
jgi:hypothetical protein